MAKDSETGVTPAAKDGEPDEDELARRRKAGNGRPIDDQAGEPPEEDDGQLFIYEGGKRVSLSSMIPRGVGVEHAFVFGSARRKGAGGLIDPEEDVLLVVRGKVGSVKPVFKRDVEERIESVTIETEIKPKVVVHANTDEAMHMLAGVFEARGIRAA